MATDTMKVSFDALEAQLREVRRSIGLDVPDERPVAPVAAPARKVRAARTGTTAATRRPPVWDLVFLIAAWAGMVALVAQAL